MRTYTSQVDQRFNLLLSMSDCDFTFNTHESLIECNPEWNAPEGMATALSQPPHTSTMIVFPHQFIVLVDPTANTTKSNVYSFGVIVNEVFSRSHPYEGINKFECGMQVCPFPHTHAQMHTQKSSVF